MAVAGRRETVGAEPGRSRPPFRTPGNRPSRRCPHAAAMTIGLFHLGLVTQPCAWAIPTVRIARNEVIANASLRPISGFALRRRPQKSAGIGPVRRRPMTNSPPPTHASAAIRSRSSLLSVNAHIEHFRERLSNGLWQYRAAAATVVWVRLRQDTTYCRHGHRRASAGSWTPSVRPRVRERQTHPEARNARRR
jgi:hypothetical protein